MKFPIIPAIVVAVFVLGFFTGRMSAPPSSTTSAPVVAAPMGQPPPMMPPPNMMPPSEPTGGEVVTGVVAEVMQVPNYTYVRLSTGGGDEWAAVATNAAITAGQKLTVRVSTRMQGFVSKSLNRTFDSIIFGELGSAGAAPGPLAEGAQLPPNHPPMGAPPAAGNPADTVAKAIDATRLAEPALSMRVADIFSEKQMLAGRMVKVTGKLSKVTDVAGMHYGHLSDASGKDDLVIISKAALPNDQQVSVQGMVVLDKDVGIGAKWAVALDNVTVAK